MNELRVRYMLEALRTVNHPDDYNFRQALRKELAVEFNLVPPANTKKRIRRQ